MIIEAIKALGVTEFACVAIKAKWPKDNSGPV